MKNKRFSLVSAKKTRQQTFMGELSRESCFSIHPQWARHVAPLGTNIDIQFFLKDHVTLSPLIALSQILSRVVVATD